MKSLTFTCRIGLILFVAASCAKKAEDSPATTTTTDKISNVLEAAISEAGSSASSVDGGSSRILMSTKGAHSLATCSYTSARGACSATVATVTWNCNIGLATLTGVITEDYSGFGAAVCALNGDGSSVSRVIDTNNPRVLTYGNYTLIADNVPGTAWDGTTFGSASSGTTITRLETGTSNGFTCASNNGCYHVVHNGLHNVFKYTSTTLYDSILTSDLTFQGSIANSNRNVSGTMTIWHQLAQYKAVHTFSSVAWGDSTCCYPTSGTLSTALTGSVTGTASMTFSTTCGQATFTGTDGATETHTLKQCQY